MGYLNEKMKEIAGMLDDLQMEDDADISVAAAKPMDSEFSAITN